jgi:hypothetical protein
MPLKTVAKPRRTEDRLIVFRFMEFFFWLIDPPLPPTLPFPMYFIAVLRASPWGGISMPKRWRFVPPFAEKELFAAGTAQA